SGLGGYNCSNCGRSVAFKACQSNANGNRGRLVATCHLTNAQGEQCKFIRFAPGGSKSPSASPPSMSTPAFPPTPLALPTGPVPSRCPIQGCGQTRIAEDCPRRICRKHCVDQDGRPHPRFASHLTPIYTESLTREYELQQTNARLDAERIASAKQAAQKVTVYAWKPDADEPEIRSIQQGFTWPYFKLSPAMLAFVDLGRTGELGALQMYDDVDLEAWLTVDVGHVVVVHEGQREIHHPHLRTGLRQERAFVREAHKAAASSQKRKAMSPPDSFSPPVKRERSSDSTKTWPRDYYTSDIAACFRDSKTSVRGPHKRTAAVVFNDHFPHLTYRHSTFYENKAIWRDAPQNLKDRFRVIGKNKRGLWSVFTCAVREAEKAQAT
ncbi:hypothetical protein BDZ97DRAFT_1603433, partial [Flammula alnicola]